MSTDKIRVDSVTTQVGQTVYSVVLNKPKALNALDLDMAHTMLALLTSWKTDDSVAAVIISGEGEKALCAGGDIVSMYNAMLAQPKHTPESIQAFFTTEYELDYLIHTYPKPVIVIGQGVVMGGGMGLFCGASHRLVTPTSRFAMPEITIGLYPDVGGSYFLPRLPAGIGAFLGLTGIAFNGQDALDIGLADFAVENNVLPELLEKLSELPHIGEQRTHPFIDEVLGKFKPESLPEGQITKYQDVLAELSGCADLNEAAAFLSHLDDNDKWLSKAKRTFQAGSPITAHLVWQQLRQGAQKTLAECFKMECWMSFECAALGEFQEGVRALLIDKDNQPNWLYKTIADVPQSVVTSFFNPKWQNDTHPLDHIDKN